MAEIATTPARRLWLVVLLAGLAGFALAWTLRSAWVSQLPGWPAQLQPPAIVEENVATRHVSQTAPAAYALPPDGEVRGAVLFIADGMGLAQLAAARAALLGPDGRFAIERLPVTGLVATHPAGGLVTKSDAAATALASGQKTVNGRIGAGADGRPLRSIVESARDHGLATALVTTTEIVDATPASFGAHSAERGARQQIAAQLLASRVDVLLGAGAGWFLPANAPSGKRTDGRDLVAEARQQGYAVARTADELAQAPAGKLLGLFDFDLAGVLADRPTLAAMTEKTLQVLAARPRFLAMIEQEGVDTRAHRNSFASMAASIEALDQAVALAVDWAQRDGRVLVVVTADHETGGLALLDGGSDHLKLAWTTTGHSGVPVPLFAYGPGALRFTGLHDNTEIPRLLAGALGIPAPDAP
jgi:alkaline phosphatase